MHFVYRNDPFQALEAHLNVDSFFSDLVDLLHEEEMEALARELNFPTAFKSQIFSENEFYGRAVQKEPEFDYNEFVNEIDAKNRVLYPNPGQHAVFWKNCLVLGVVGAAVVVAFVALRLTVRRGRRGPLGEKSLSKVSY